MNVSLWETIRRSLATTFITLLPVAALFLFGGATLKDFAFALLIGVTSGAYSSIFIAAPMLTLWKQREPEYARRKAEPTPLGQGGRSSRSSPRPEQAAAEEPTPETPIDYIEDRRSKATETLPRTTRRPSWSAGASAGGHGPMAAPGNPSDLERLIAILGPRVDELRSFARRLPGPLARRRGARRRGHEASRFRSSRASSVS